MAEEQNKSILNEGSERKVEMENAVPSTTKRTVPKKQKSTPETESQQFSMEEVRAMIAEALREQKKELEEQLKNTQPQVVMQVKQDDMVTLLFLGAIADGTVVTLGKLGQINRAGGTIDVPKSEFFQGLNSTVEKMLQNRKLIVVNGLTQEERERFNVNYKDGELLTQKTYFKVLDLDVETLKQLYAKLCDEHKRTVATLFISAYEKGDPRVNAEKVKALNKLSKKVKSKITQEPEKDGLFFPILESMGKKLLEDEEE